MGKQLARTSIWVTIIMVAGYGLSFLKESFVAKYFGVSSDVDAYTIALQIPVSLFALVSVSIQSIVIPIYSDLLYNKGKGVASHYINNLISVVTVISLLLVILFEGAAGGLIYLFAPGFTSETHALAVELLRITLPTILFSVVSNIFIGLLNVHKKFVLTSFPVYFLNAGLIASIGALHAAWGIKSACIGQVVGSVLQISFLYIVTRKYHPFAFELRLKDEKIRKTLKLSMPILWSVSISEVNTMVNRIIASFLFVGSIAALGYASKINSIFMTLFISAISTIVYPLYAESSAKKNMGQLNSRVNRTLSIYTFFLIPLMIGVFCFRTEIVQVAFARGNFDAYAVNITQSLLGCYALGILFMAFRETVTKVFFSLQDTVTPAKNATLGAILNVILSILLSFVFGVQGLAVAASITAMVISIRLLFQLTKHSSEINLSDFFCNAKKIILAAGLMFVSAIFFKPIISDMSPIYILLIGAAVCSTVYLACVIVLKIPILKYMTGTLLSKQE